MSIATGTLGGETRIRFAGVGFDVYESLIRATPPRTAVRMAFDGKDLEIMVKGPVHDNYGRLLDRFITAIAAALGISHRGLGETTWIRPELERGLEADQCYVFDPAKLDSRERTPGPQRERRRGLSQPRPGRGGRPLASPGGPAGHLRGASGARALEVRRRNREHRATRVGRAVRRYRPEPMAASHRW